MKRIGLSKGLRFVASIVLVCAVLSPAVHAQQELSADQQELRKVAMELREAILREDIEGILRHLRQGHGLTCTDTKIPYKQVKGDLYNKNSHLYMSLFDSTRWHKRCGDQYPAEYPAISEKEFFSKTIDEPIEVSSIKDGWAKVTFRSRDWRLYPREWYFHKERKTWKFADGFILSRCSCG